MLEKVVDKGLITVSGAKKCQKDVARLAVLCYNQTIS